jgi:hypothetical protein
MQDEKQAVLNDILEINQDDVFDTNSIIIMPTNPEVNNIPTHVEHGFLE